MNNYAHFDHVKVGTRLKADGGFTCIEEGSVLTVAEYGNELFVPCNCGQHFLDGQLDDGDRYIGFTLVAAEVSP